MIALSVTGVDSSGVGSKDGDARYRVASANLRSGTSETFGLLLLQETAGNLGSVATPEEASNWVLVATLEETIDLVLVATSEETTNWVSVAKAK